MKFAPKAALLILAVVGVIMARFAMRTVQAQTARNPVTAVQQPTVQPEGFGSPQEIRFDESMGTKLPTPTIPKSWKLISVSNGEKANANNLWFQDSAGNVYLLQGFTSHSEFIANPRVQFLRAK